MSNESKHILTPEEPETDDQLQNVLQDVVIMEYRKQYFGYRDHFKFYGMDIREFLINGETICNTGLIPRDSIEIICELPHECKILNQENHEESLQNYAGLSIEQKDFINSIKEKIILMTKNDQSNTECVFLTGYGGTGKTTTLKYILDVVNSNVENSNILYIAYTARLCAEIRVKFNIRAKTFYQFFNELTDRIKYLSCIKSNFFSQIEPLKTSVGVIFLDEFSMFPPDVLQQFKQIIEDASKELDKKILIIFCGDFMHIPPLFSHSMDYGPIINCIGKQNTSNFNTQFRITDEAYLNTIMKLTQIPLIAPGTFLEELVEVVPQNFLTPLFNYTFPFAYIEQAYEKFKTRLDYQSWFKSLDSDFFSKVLTLKAFAYTNLEINNMNIYFAYTIIDQFIERGDNFEYYNNFVHFVFYEPIDFQNELPEKIPVLPLIRFFPYRLLIETADIPNIYKKSVVYLIDWNLKENFVSVYYPENKQFLKVNFNKFFMNLHKEQTLYGIPLELEFGSTLHLAQGQTITEDIAVSLNNIDYRELFSILTSIRSPQQIKHLYMS